MPVPDSNPAITLRALESALATVANNNPRPENAVRARAEIVFSHLADVNAAVLVANNRGRYVHVNDEAARLTGYTHDELLRLSVWDLTPIRGRVDSRRLWREFLKHGRLSGDYELRRKDGRTIKAHYIAVTNVLPGIHVSLLVAGRRMRATKKPTVHEEK